MISNLKILIIAFLFTLVLPSYVHAKELQQQYNISANKVWNIKFNTEIDAKTLDGNIIIRDSDGNLFDSSLSLSNDCKTVTVTPKVQYTANKTYIITISKNIKSLKGSSMSEDVTESFSTQSTVGSIIHGVAMFPYYRYNGNYYSLKDPSPDIQKSISKHLYGDFYEIKGMDTSKSIALFTNKYYWRLDYAFKDTVTFNGKPYLINANTEDTPSKCLGQADKYGVYKLPDSDTSEGILVKIGNTYCIAYQYLSSVMLKGITYELEFDKQKINNVNSEEYIGMAGPYKAYKYDNNDISKTIMIHINDTEEVVANATTIMTTSDSLPVSNYGSPEESMYPLFQTVQWRGHGIYSLGDQGESDLLKQKLGKQISNFSCDGYNYGIYEMKGVDPSKSVIVKNNQVYFRYYFIFTDTIIFNGKTYVIGDDSNKHYIKGNQLGWFGQNKVYEIKGVNPDEVIDVFMLGSNLQSDFTAYRQDN